MLPDLSDMSLKKTSAEELLLRLSEESRSSGSGNAVSAERGATQAPAIFVKFRKVSSNLYIFSQPFLEKKKKKKSSRNVDNQGTKTAKPFEEQLEYASGRRKSSRFKDNMSAEQFSRIST